MKLNETFFLAKAESYPTLRKVINSGKRLWISPRPEWTDWHLTHIHNISRTMRVFTRDQSAQFCWSFELRITRMMVFWPVCTQDSVIWIVQFKWWSGGVFQWCTSQITQQNRCMNVLTSKLRFGGRSYVTFWPFPVINRAFSNRNSISKEITISMSENSSLSCTLGNSNIAKFYKSSLQFGICSRVKTLNVIWSSIALINLSTASKKDHLKPM